MEATGVQVDTEKLLHFDELLKVIILYRSKTSSKLLNRISSLQLRIAHVESTAHKV